MAGLNQFLSFNCVCCHIGNHPGVFATFGYKPAYESRNFLKILLYPDCLLEQCVETWRFSRIVFHQMPKKSPKKKEKNTGLNIKKIICWVPL
jgi:hypothetical protein